MVDDLVTGTVESRREHALGDRHSDRVGRSLAERTRRRLAAGSLPILGMARSLAAPLPELLQVVEREVVAGQVKKTVQEHAAVPRRQNEPVSVGPVRVAGIVLQVLLPQHVGHRGRAEGKARMTGGGFLDGVDRERADGIDAELVEGVENGAHSRSSLSRGIDPGVPDSIGSYYGAAPPRDSRRPRRSSLGGFPARARPAVRIA